MKTIAIIMPMHHSYQRGTLRGILTFASANPDWHIELLPVQEESFLSLAQIKPAGLIINTTPENTVPEKWLAPVKRAGLPLVSLYWKTKYPGAFFVTDDDVACGRLMARHLLDCGGRQFAFVGLEEGNSITQQRLKGFQKEIGSRKLPLQVLFRQTQKTGAARLNNLLWEQELTPWLKKQSRPLAIAAHNDGIGYAILKVCWKMNIRVPEKVMVLGVDNDRILCHLPQPPLSSISMPWQRIGGEAFRLLTQKINGKRKLPRELVIPPVRVVPRGSTDRSLAVNDDVAAATKFIRANVNNPNLDVSQVTEAVALSRSSLQRRFKQHLGCTILEQIQRTRLTQAKRLLVETGLPIKTIAKRVGFSGIGRMDKVFLEDMKMSPREFRARFRYPTMS